VGTLDVYSTQPRAWTAHELEGAGEFAAVAGELVHTSVELAARELELAQLRQALTSRVWIEQAKGVLGPSGHSSGMSPPPAPGRGDHGPVGLHQQHAGDEPDNHARMCRAHGVASLGG
jgi:hypothetical protein